MCTNIQGVVETVAPGEYCVVGDVIIAADVTLDIPPGTTFRFMGPYHFGRDAMLPDTADSESGSIRAVGTEAEPIIFRGETPTTAWLGITISHAREPVHLEYVTIRDAQKEDVSPISRIYRRGAGLASYQNAAGTIIRHCRFINNHAHQVGGGLEINGNGVWPNAGLVEITATLFEGNSCECEQYAISNDSDVCGGGAVRFSHVAINIFLVDNIFRNNRAVSSSTVPAYGGAIGAFDTAIPIGSGNVFQNNQATAGDGAISCANNDTLGVNFVSVDSSNLFLANLPNNGCGM